VNDKISQRLIQILEFRGLPQHARSLNPRPIIGLVGSVVQRFAAGLNLQLPQLKVLLTARDYAGIGTMRDGITALDRGLSATLCVPRAEASPIRAAKSTSAWKKDDPPEFLGRAKATNAKHNNSPLRFGPISSWLYRVGFLKRRDLV
jgi:hypothetical protein